MIVPGQDVLSIYTMQQQHPWMEPFLDPTHKHSNSLSNRNGLQYETRRVGLCDGEDPHAVRTAGGPLWWWGPPCCSYSGWAFVTLEVQAFAPWAIYRRTWLGMQVCKCWIWCSAAASFAWLQAATGRELGGIRVTSSDNWLKKVHPQHPLECKWRRPWAGASLYGCSCLIRAKQHRSCEELMVCQCNECNIALWLRIVLHWVCVWFPCYCYQ